VFFTFLFPVVMLTIFSVAFSTSNFFGKDAAGHAVTAAAYYLPGMLAAGVLLSGLQNLAIDIAGEKSDGTLKRLAGTPLSVTSYFIGKIGRALVTGILQAALLILLAKVAFGVPIPTDPAKWLTFAWVFLSGLTACSLLGIAMSSVPRTAKSATAVITLPFLVLQFISGVFIAIDSISGWMLQVGSFFPLKWMCQGFRGVFLPDQAKVLEQAGDWEYGRIALVLAAWCIGGLVLCLTTFRWKSRRDG
jgi:ABC-2 type transport system permease protein